MDTLATSTPVADHVRVDLELTGARSTAGSCSASLACAARRARCRGCPTTPVCIECKRRGYVCVVVAKGEPCLGP